MATEAPSGIEEGSARAGVRGLWPAALALALLGILALTTLSFRSLRSTAQAWDRLLATEVAELVQAERLASVSELGARLTRDAILTGDPRAFRALGANRAQVADLLERARKRARGAEEAALVAAIAWDHAAIAALCDELIDARLAGESAETLVFRLEVEVRPLRNRIDERLAVHSHHHEAALARGRAEIAAEEQGAFRALGGGAAAALLLALLLAGSLRRSLDDLRRSEARFRATFEQAAIGIAHVGLDGRWLRLNARYRELLGYPEEELRRMTFLEVTHPDDRANEVALYERVLAGEPGGAAVEKRYLHRDGSVRWVSLTRSLVRDRAGRPAYVIAAAADIAERKWVEEELREAVRARDEFLQVASHELRTPLTILQLQVESARAVLGRGAPEPARLDRKLESALRQVGRLNALVDSLLDVSRLGAAEVALTPDEADLAEVARAVVERARPAAERDGTELRLDAKTPVRASFDPDRIAQAIGHLVSNALRYGVGRPVDVIVSGDGAVARVVVRDRGNGVAPAERERIFGRFERAASWHHYGGLGLGLFVARRVVEAHGGAVRVEGAPGEGATFVLELPVHGPAAERGAAARDDGSAAHPGLH